MITFGTLSELGQFMLMKMFVSPFMPSFLGKSPTNILNSCTKTHTKCKKLCVMRSFFRPDRSYSPKCCLCRGEVPSQTIPSFHYCLTIVHENCVAANISTFLSANFSVSLRTSFGVASAFEIFSSACHPVPFGAGKLRINLEYDILRAVHQTEGYVYEDNGGSNTRAEFRCKQGIRSKSNDGTFEAG